MYWKQHNCNENKTIKVILMQYGILFKYSGITFGGNRAIFPLPRKYFFFKVDLWFLQDFTIKDNVLFFIASNLAGSSGKIHFDYMQ